MIKKEKFNFIYNEAYNILKAEIGEKDLLLHLENDYKFNTLNDVYHGLIFSSQNGAMTPKVIKFIQKEEKIREILFDYNSEKVISSYKNAEDLLNIFKNSFSDIKSDAGKKSIWYKFSESIISGAKFLSTFKNKKDFDNFIKNFNLNKYTKASLPMLLSKEIRGFGFALSCDFLKELGYREYPKPDIHLIDLFYGLGISNSRNDYEVYKDIIEFADIIGKDAYTVDKIFWLICSGNFYRINKKMKPKKWEFIELIKNKLKVN